MNITHTVCDQCQKKHGLMVPIVDLATGAPVLNEDGEPVIIGDLTCYMEWRRKDWMHLEAKHMRNRSAVDHVIELHRNRAFGGDR